MRLVHSVGVVVAELVNDLGDSVMVAFCERVPYRRLESTALLSQLRVVQPLVMCFGGDRGLGQEGDQVRGEGHVECRPLTIAGGRLAAEGVVQGVTYSNAPALRLS